MDVSIILTRREHWTWEEIKQSDSWGTTRWNRKLDPLLEAWIKANGAPNVLKPVEILKNKNHTKTLKECYLRFTNLKLAKLFILTWNIPQKHIFVGDFNKRIANERLALDLQKKYGFGY